MPANIPIVIALISSVGMALAWAVQKRTGNSGWIDTVWSALVGISALTGIVLSGLLSNERGALGAILVLIWSSRLAIHITRRSYGAHDDPRYQALLEEWGQKASAKLFWFLQIQALVSFGLAISVVAAIGWSDRPLTPFDWLAALIALIAIGGEMVADNQLARFRKENGGRGLVCNTGFWQWSRHPNYFFEWLYWCAWPILALSADAPWATLSLIAPIMMYVLLVHVSGIPPLEEHMLRSRGEAFRRYQERVNAFFPGPTKPAAHRELEK